MPESRERETQALVPYYLAVAGLTTLLLAACLPQERPPQKVGPVKPDPTLSAAHQDSHSQPIPSLADIPIASRVHKGIGSLTTDQLKEFYRSWSNAARLGDLYFSSEFFGGSLSEAEIPFNTAHLSSVRNLTVMEYAQRGDQTRWLIQTNPLANRLWLPEFRVRMFKGEDGRINYKYSRGFNNRLGEKGGYSLEESVNRGEVLQNPPVVERDYTDRETTFRLPSFSDVRKAELILDRLDNTRGTLLLHLEV